jgi:transcriptional regulator with XRE-family HTH domain
MNTFNQNVKSLRLSMNLSIKEASAALGIPYNTYYMYENKPIQPNFDMLIKICDLYNYKDIYKLITEDLYST